ncbi:tRNA (uridine(34)/cytosine(34)/5-carboxymethylaminomethyluridine(34)-2'-O)-methyltransferase TrmL [Desulforamulus ruminis]|uniref:tRNA (uridine(34)/cytosine(34)/5- carboxymethylaminomethyluridine(34)-2'-O)- methyltransferase TrmL n=1 Tax=Desulforamulus ruminis TaxID=1564 RepID=UPI002354C3E8|nr:tRNA (uridine(34)/cytosine(34)/5-carboxymethylaminomethyluridine(34)-2'-O)-methyltransferase TrmL [Desulforamulus ruminis]
MHIVLVEPEIPANTGNIARTCSVTGASLHLVKPLGFSTDDRYLKRAGLDYWHQLDLHYHEDFSALRRQYPDGRFWYLSTKAAKSYHQVEYKEDDFLVFGKETAGLPKALLAQNPEYCLRIPMLESVRSLNLSNSAAVVLYEALRQLEFPQMK